MNFIPSLPLRYNKRARRYIRFNNTTDIYMNVFVVCYGLRLESCCLMCGRALASPEYPTPSPANIKGQGVTTMLLHKSKGDWNIISKAWYSLLLNPGMFVVNCEDHRAYLVTFV